MSYSQQINKTTDILSKKANQVFSQYSENLRFKINWDVDYQKDFDFIFQNFPDKKLPKNDLFYEIKGEMEAIEDGK